MRIVKISHLQVMRWISSLSLIIFSVPSHSDEYPQLPVSAYLALEKGVGMALVSCEYIDKKQIECELEQRFIRKSPKELPSKEQFVEEVLQQMRAEKKALSDAQLKVKCQPYKDITRNLTKWRLSIKEPSANWRLKDPQATSVEYDLCMARTASQLGVIYQNMIGVAEKSCSVEISRVKKKFKLAQSEYKTAWVHQSDLRHSCDLQTTIVLRALEQTASGAVKWGMEVFQNTLRPSKIEKEVCDVKNNRLKYLPSFSPHYLANCKYLRISHVSMPFLQFR